MSEIQQQQSQPTNQVSGYQPNNYLDNLHKSFFQPFEAMTKFVDQMHQEMGRAFESHNQAFDQSFGHMDQFIQKGPEYLPPNTKNTNYYCSSTQTTILPNGVRETNRHVRSNQIEEDEHFCEVGDKRSVTRRTKDLVSGQEDQRRDLFNVKEDEVDSFYQDFQGK